MKRTKRYFALTIALGLIFTTFSGVNIFAETEINECNYNDGSARISVTQPEGFDKSDIIVDTGDEHIKALRVRKTTNQKGAATDEVIDWRGLPALTSDFSSLSFDIMPMREDLNASISLISKNSDGADARSIAISFTSGGKITCGDAWTVVDSTSSTQIGSYSKGEWLSFTVTYDKTEQKMIIYLNNQNVREITNDKIAAFKDFVQLDKVRFYVTASMGLAGEELLWLDNVRWVTGLEKGTMGACVSDFDEKNKRFTISFSKQPKPSELEGNIVLKRANVNEGEEEIPLTITENNGLSVTCGYSKTLAPSSEYAVVFQGVVTGINGGELKDRYLYYTTEPNVSSVTVQECNYDDGNAEVKTLIPDGYGDDDRIAETGDEHIKALRIRKITNSGGEAADEVNNWSGLRIPDGDISAISFDIRPKKSDLYASVSLVGGSAAAQTEPVTVSFYRNGQIVCGKSWTIVAGGAGTLIGTYQKDDWINFRFVFDKLSQTMAVYINGEMKKVFNRDELSSFKFTNIGFVRFFVSKSMGLSGEELFWLDNVKTEKLETKVSVDRLRVNDSEKTNIGPFGVVNRKIKSIDIRFGNEVNENTLTSDKVTLLYDGEAIDYEGVYDESERLFKITPLRLPDANARIEIKVCKAEDKSGMEVEPYSGYVIADNSEDEFKITDVYFSDADGKKTEDVKDGETLYLNASVINTTDEDKNILVSVMGYKDSSLKKFDYREVTVREGEMYIIGNDTNVLGINSSDVDSIMSTIQDGDRGIALADPVYCKKADEKGGAISFEHKSDKLRKGDMISIDVFAPEKSFKDLGGAHFFSDVLAYKTQTTAKDDGSYSVSFGISYPEAVSGMYTLNAAANDYLYNTRFLYVNPTKAEKALTGLLIPAADSGNAKTAGEVLYKNQYDFYIDDKYLDKDIAERAAELLIEYRKGASLTIDNSKTVINKCVAVSAFESGKITDIFSEAEIFDLKNSAIGNLYDKSFVDEKTSENVTKRLKGKRYGSINGFYESLNDAFVLAAVENSVEPNSAKTVMNAFGIYGETSEHYSYVSGKHYDTISELQADIENYKPKGHSGGGSGGSGGINRTTVVDTTKNDENMPKPSDNTMSFVDLENVKWASEAIDYLAKLGIVNGKETDKFYPTDNITREEFIKILTGVSDIGKEREMIEFSDMKEDVWYTDYIKKAYCGGVAEGYDDGRFGIGDNITRQDMAVMIYRAAVKSGIVFERFEKDEPFSDDGNIADYAQEGVYVLKNIGIINGKGDNLFEPNAFATRAEAAKMIYGLVRDNPKD